MRVIAASAPLRRSPQADAPLDTEALYGESVTVYDEQAGWAWAQLDRDQYVGYLPSAALGNDVRTDPSTRGIADARLSRPGHQGAAADGAVARLTAQDRGPSGRLRGLGGRALLLVTPFGGIGRARAGRCRDRRAFSRDALSLGRPDVGGCRLLGARPNGAGRRGDRVAARQRHEEAILGEPVVIDDPTAPLARGDLIFWKGHVGIMRDPVTLLHANGWHMKTVSEPLAQARERIAANGGGKVTSARRL